GVLAGIGLWPALRMESFGYGTLPRWVPRSPCLAQSPRRIPLSPPGAIHRLFLDTPAGWTVLSSARTARHLPQVARTEPLSSGTATAALFAERSGARRSRPMPWQSVPMGVTLPRGKIAEPSGCGIHEREPWSACLLLGRKRPSTLSCITEMGRASPAAETARKSLPG